jgi:hypothetical protein
MMAKMRSLPRRSGGESMIDMSEAIFALLFLMIEGVSLWEARSWRGVIIGTLKIFFELTSSGPRSTLTGGSDAQFDPRGLYKLGSSASSRIAWRLSVCNVFGRFQVRVDVTSFTYSSSDFEATIELYIYIQNEDFWNDTQMVLDWGLCLAQACVLLHYWGHDPLAPCCRR